MSVYLLRREEGRKHDGKLAMYIYNILYFVVLPSGSALCKMNTERSSSYYY